MISKSVGEVGLTAEACRLATESGAQLRVTDKSRAGAAWTPARLGRNYYGQVTAVRLRGFCLAEFARDFGIRIKHRQDLVGLGRRQPEDQMREAPVLKALRRIFFGRDTENAELQILEAAPGAIGGLAQLLQALLELLTAAIDRHPAVAVVDDPLERLLGLGAEQDFRAARLDRLGPRPDRIEIDEFAVEFRPLVAPDLFHRAASPTGV